MFGWLIETLDNHGYMSAETNFDKPQYGNQDRTKEFCKLGCDVNDM